MLKRRPRRLFLVVLLSACMLIYAVGIPAQRAQAQEENLTVTIIHPVDDTAFPKVVVHFVVQDEDNLPITGLTPKDLEVTEDGKRVPASSIDLVGDPAPPIRLVLALDVSVDEATFPQMKAAVKRFVDALGEQDQVAVLAFADEVTEVQDFGPPDEASKAIDGLESGGNYTVLNEATEQAARTASGGQLAIKAAVIVTDSPSNLGAAPQEALASLEQIGVPIHLVGFGRKIAADKAEEMKTLARVTGGQAFVLPTVDQIADPLHVLNVLLHQGYKLSYQSTLPVSDAPRKLSISVSHLGREAQAETSFTAASGKVVVRVDGLRDGEEVGGLVHLTTVAAAPSDIVSVEYLLDGVRQESLSQPPYRYTWDTATATLGQHVLEVKVTDKAGNESSQKLTVKVSPLVAVTVSAAQSQIDFDAKTTVQAQPTSIADLAHVLFLVDGKLKSPIEQPPYQITIDGRDLGPGEHIVTARAVDVQGRSEEARVSVRVQPPPTPIPTPTPIPETRPPVEQAWPVGVLLGIILIVGILTGLVLSAQKKRRRTVFQLQIHNAGNIRDRYALWTEAEAAIKAHFARNGAPLTPREIMETVSAAETVAVPAVAGTAAASPGVQGSARQERGRPGIGDKVRKTSGFVNAIAHTFMSIASFLPASIRAPVQKALSTWYRGEGQVRRASAASARVSRTVGRAKPAGAGRAAPRQAGGAPPSAAAPAGQITRTAQVTRTLTRAGYQTPLVEPDEQLALDIVIDPIRQHYKSRDYLLKVFSRSIDLEGAPMVIAQESIQVQGVSVLRRIFPFVLIYGAALLSLVILWLVLTYGL